VLLVNAGALFAVGALLVLYRLAVSQDPHASEVLILAGGLIAVLALDALLVRRTLTPLRRLRHAMARVDPLDGLERLDLEGLDADVREVARGFNEMVDRLRAERRDAARWALAGHETERRRLAHELDDDVEQILAALLLRLDRVASGLPGGQRDDIDEARRAAHEALRAVRAVVDRLRPDALDELGLPAALRSLCRRLSATSRVRVDHELDPSLPRLPADVELVVYRVAHEAIANALRHAEVSRITVTLAPEGEEVVLRVRDDGRGRPMPLPRPSGLPGLRERALSVDGAVTLAELPGGAVELTLRVPFAPLHAQAPALPS